MDGRGVGVSTSSPHGVKRRAEEDPRDDQRLAKRFDLLNLGKWVLNILQCVYNLLMRFPEHNGKLYVPVSQPPSRRPVATEGAEDSMHLDDTKDKVYINNLDEQISEIEAEERMVFLPDIEKKLGKIPHYLLTGDIRPTAENQMVLYGVPASISVPEEQDNVRKAMIESRARAREKQLLDAEAAKARSDPIRGITCLVTRSGDMTDAREMNADEDQDAMDLG